MPIRTLTFSVPGDPLPKGSTKAFVVAGKARTTSATKGLKEWENRVRMFAPAHDTWFYGPVAVRVHFQVTRPKSVRALDHTTKPDLDKLARAVGDALTALLYRDDSQINEWHVRKDYATQGAVTVITVRGNTDAPRPKPKRPK